MNAKLCKHLRRMARDAGDGERAYVARRNQKPRAVRSMLGDVPVLEWEPTVTLLNAPHTSRAIYRALKREARKHRPDAVRRWRLKEKTA